MTAADAKLDLDGIAARVPEMPAAVVVVYAIWVYGQVLPETFERADVLGSLLRPDRDIRRFIDDSLRRDPPAFRRRLADEAVRLLGWWADRLEGAARKNSTRTGGAP